MPTSSRAKAPAQQQLDMLSEAFGSGYFEQGRVVLTAVRDIAGVMKVAHRLQSKVNERFGAVVEVIMEHIKFSLWSQLHESATSAGILKGEEVPQYQVTHIPEGVRVHPYRRDALPTLEVLLLWDDASKKTCGRCLYSMTHPELPTLDKVDEIFALIEPYFALRWVFVQLHLSKPISGEFEAEGPADEVPPAEAGGGFSVTVLACHPYGFASEENSERPASVQECQPLQFEGVTDETGLAKVCFLPAAVNKIIVPETARFYGTEVLVTKSALKELHEGHTPIEVELTPKALATVKVNVFVLPKSLPNSDADDGLIDWSAEDRAAITNATVQLQGLQGRAVVSLHHVGDGLYIDQDGDLPEGSASLCISCPGFESEDQALILLMGENEFWVPLRAEA